MPAPAVTVESDLPAAGAVVTNGLFRAGVAVVPSAGFPVVLAGGGAGDGEGYRLEASAEGIRVEAATDAGLVRAAATVRQLLWSGDGVLHVAPGEIDDEPVVPLRMLAGWGLYRAHRLDWALEVALEGKFNRVLYNWWTATPGERMGPAEDHLVRRARSLGIELVAELRRQALGPAFSPGDRTARAQLYRHYDDAVEHGFRSFGFLFDDTDVDAFEAEIELLVDLVEHLTDRLGDEPEFFFCPRFYWFPGQMDYSWMAALMAPGESDRGPSMAPMLGGEPVRPPEEAAQRQRAYLAQLGAALPERTHVYLANWWSGTPEGWERELGDGWTSLVGRAPVFWDNQQQNDFRAAAVAPMPLHQRPPGFAVAVAGYCLNSGVPLSAYAAASVTAGAWAWNPEDYDPSLAFGAAIARLFPGASEAVTAAAAAWGAVLGELMAPRVGMENHYRGLWRVAREGRTGEVEARVTEMAARLATAATSLSPRAHPLARDALAELLRETDRLRLDYQLARVVAAGGPVEEGERLVAAIASLLAERLPPVPELAAVVAGEGEDDGEPVPGISWFLHFVAGPLRAGPRALLDRLPRSRAR